ncbi:PDZ domain and LETM1-like domain-containing protein [Dirofilaria immitis]|nr:PDZ domain and LETM1-like domain-containing protein [Dirofilaria immitis]
MFNWSLSISSTTLKSVKSLSPSTSSSFSRTFLENITRSPFYHSLTSLDKTKLWSKFYVDDEENVQKVLDVVSVDQKVITNPHSNRRRRTVIVTRNNDEPFGFTLQTYLLKRKGDDVPSKVTYVDYVQLDSPAADAGIRAGDMIISINGHVVTAMSHEELIKLIGSYHQMRMVVIFENIRQHIELVARAIKLRKILNDKLYQLNLIDIEEQKILNRAYLRSLSTKKITHSLLNSLSSATTSSVSSSISSVPSNLSGIMNDTEQNIIRIPTIISLTHGAMIEISKYPLKKGTLERSDFKIADSKRSMNLQSDFGKLKISNTEAQFLPVQRIRCYESDLENIDRISSSSCDTGQTVDPLVRFDNSHDDDDISNDGSKNCTAIENADNNVVDNDGDNDIAISDDFVGINCNDDNDKISAFDSIILPDNVTTVAAQIPISESMFHSIGLNHVIMLNDDVVSGEDDDDSDKIRILKL